MASVTGILRRYVFVDLEVNGMLQKDKVPPLITEIAAVDPLRSKDDPERWFHRFVLPPAEMRTPNWEKKYGHLIGTPDMQSGQESLRDFVLWTTPASENPHKVVLIGHNMYQHDGKILDFWIRQYGLKKPENWTKFCTAYLAKAMGFGECSSLNGLCDTLKVKIRPPHDAKNDVKMTHAIFKKMVGQAPLQEVLKAASLGPNEHPVRKVAEIISRSTTSIIQTSSSSSSSVTQTNAKGQYLFSRKCTLPRGALIPLSRKVHHLFMDLETTGLLPKPGETTPYPKVVQLAVYLPKQKMLFNKLINPEIPIPKEASAIHRIFDEDVVSKPTFKERWKDVQAFIYDNLQPGPDDIILVSGHNFWGFDQKVIRYILGMSGLGNLHMESFDTLAEARTLFKGELNPFERGFFRLEYLSPLLGISVDKAHDAGGDVTVNSALFDAFVEGLDEREVFQAMWSKHPILTLRDLVSAKGSFNAKEAFQRFQKACGVTIPMAHALLPEVQNNSFFLPRNLAVIFDVQVQDDDKEDFILWRIFLKMTEGIERKQVMECFKEDYLQNLLQIGEETFKKNLTDSIDYSTAACQLALTLGKALLQKKGKRVGDLIDLARILQIEIRGETVDQFEMKKIFLVLTKGLKRGEIAPLLNDAEGLQKLVELIESRGSFSLSEEARAVDDRSSSSSSSRGIKRLTPHVITDSDSEDEAALEKVPRTI